MEGGVVRIEGGVVKKRDLVVKTLKTVVKINISLWFQYLQPELEPQAVSLG